MRTARPLIPGRSHIWKILMIISAGVFLGSMRATCRIITVTARHCSSGQNAAGAGPYLAFDTQNEPDGSFRDTRNAGGVFSIAAIWKLESRWSLQARVNTILVHRNFDTTALLFGVGYRLDSEPSKGTRENRSTKRGL